MPEQPLARLSHVTALNLPDTWAAVPNVATNDRAWTGDVAATLCDGAQAQALVAAKLAEAHSEMISEAHVVVGVWVPDRVLPDIAGMFFLDWVVPTDDGLEVNRRTYRSLLDPDCRTDHVTYRRMLKELDVPAGPALLVHEVIARPLKSWKRMVQENITYTVFPRGCSDAVTLAFVSFAPEFGDVLAHDAEVGVNSLRLALAQPQWSS